VTRDERTDRAYLAETDLPADSVSSNEEPTEATGTFALHLAHDEIDPTAIGPAVAPFATWDREAPVAVAGGAPAGSVALTAIGREILAWLRTLVSAAVYATLIVTFGFQVARVEGLSMAPTLANQDRLIVNKFAYLIGSPRPGDIVMMYYPSDPDKSFVKRVIAEPGDVVRIEDGRVYVNDVRLADDFVAPDFRSHDDHPPKVVEEGYYYVLGDHRNNSSDSREWGEVPKKYIVGKVQLRWWPISSARVF
jgi:signal peptidase I